ncbi:MAG: HEAT repeat domain-containing protein [Synechococcus lacustris]
MNPELSPNVNEHLQAVEAAASSEALLHATRSLVSLCAQLEPHSNDQQAAILCLLELLGTNNPGAAVAAVDGLIACGNAAVEPLLHNLDEHNYGARAWAVRALASIGDPRGLPVLERAVATDIGPSVRRAAARGLGNLQLEQLLAAERPRIVERCLRGLALGCADGEWVVRYAAVVGLEGFLPQASAAGIPGAIAKEGRSLLEQRALTSEEDTPVVYLRAQQALENLSGAR